MNWLIFGTIRMFMKKTLAVIFWLCSTLIWCASAKSQSDYETHQKAMEGDPVAQRELGRIYAEGRDHEAAQNYEKALLWWQRAAAQGDNPARRYLGNMFYWGIGVEKRDLAQAFNWFIQAAENDDGIAQVSVANMYEHGLGVPRDLRQAFNWYQRAANNGYPEAMSILGTLYLEGSIVKQDYEKALLWLIGAAEKGDAIAQQKLAVMYADGLGADKDLVQAYAWIDLAGKSLILDQITNLKRKLEGMLTEAQLAEARTISARRFSEIQAAIINNRN